MANASKKPTMSWTEKKDVLLMREMAAQGIFQYRAGSRERGNVWQVIARNLNCHRDLFDAVTARGVRDRFTLISRRLKAKNSQELKSTGGGGETQTEYELLLEELTQLSDESDKKAETEAESVKEKTTVEKQKALDIRKQAMETMGQTKKRSEEADETKEKKKRRSGGDTMAWLEKKAERDANLKEMQLEEQREERELRRKQFQLQQENQQQLQQQQTMLMQQMMGMLQQQQQQLQHMFPKQHQNRD